MKLTKVFPAGCGSVLLAGGMLFAAAYARSAHAPQAGSVSPGDIVETNINYQPAVGEVLRSYGNTADLNLGQNNVGRYLEVQYMKVVQKAGSGALSTLRPGDTVQYPTQTVVYTGKIMKTNGAYCEIDSSGSGFTGWTKCASLRLISKAPASYADSPAAGPVAVLSISPGIAATSGAPSPVGNHGFYLLRNDAESTVAKAGVQAPAGKNLFAGLNSLCVKQLPECQKAVTSIIAESATAVKSGPDGKAVFPAVLPGTYFVFGMGQLEGKPIVWNVKVRIKAGENSVTLGRENATPAY